MNFVIIRNCEAIKKEEDVVHVTKYIRINPSTGPRVKEGSEEVSTISIEFLPMKKKGHQQISYFTVDLWGQRSTGWVILTAENRNSY